MPGYTIEFTLTPREIKAYLANRRRRRPLYLRLINWVGAFVLGGAFAFFAFMMFVSPVDPDSFKFGILWAFVAVSLFTLILFGDRILTHRAIMRAKKAGEENFKPQTIIVSPANLVNRWTLSSAELNWQGILEIIEGEDAFYLSLDKEHAIILPHHAIREAGNEPAELLRDMKTWRAQAPSLETKCPKCGYDLEGTAVQGCPECGWARETKDANS